jgi:tetratricopeptide (TPR) repeat protein
LNPELRYPELRNLELRNFELRNPGTLEPRNLVVASDNPRIVELRRRVEADPSSIAFAQLAEEYRRAGNLEEAEQVCRQGLARHPGYLSARVTLGRTLVERGDLEAAMQELHCVLDSAPDNLAAIRAIAEIHQRRGELEKALDYYSRAVPLARHDPEREETVNQINRELGGIKTPPAASPGTLSFEEAQNELMNAVLRLAEAAPPEALAQKPIVFAPPVLAAPPSDPVASVDIGPPIEIEPPANVEPPAAIVPPAVNTAPRVDLATLISSITAAREPSSGSGNDSESPPKPEPEPQLTANADTAPPSDDESRVDFDELLKALGRTDQSAPPQVEALLQEPGAAGASGAGGAEGPVRGEGAVPGEGARDAREHRTEPVAAEHRTDAPVHDTAPVAPEHRSGAPDASVHDAPVAADAPSAPIARGDAAILTELEAWLAALKR